MNQFVSIESHIAAPDRTDERQRPSWPQRNDAGFEQVTADRIKDTVDASRIQ